MLIPKCHNVTLVMIARSLSSLKLVSKSMICLQLRCWSNTWTAAAAQTINFLKVQGRWRTIFLIIISHDSTVYSMRDAKKRITPHFIIAKFATGCRICRVSYYVIVKKNSNAYFSQKFGLGKIVILVPNKCRGFFFFKMMFYEIRWKKNQIYFFKK